MKCLHQRTRLAAVVASTLMTVTPCLQAQSTAPRRAPAQPTQAQLDAMRQQLAEQAQILENLRKALGEQDARTRELQQALDTQRRERDAAAQAQAQAQQQREQAQRAAAEAPRTVQVGTAPAESTMVIPHL